MKPGHQIMIVTELMCGDVENVRNSLSFPFPPPKTHRSNSAHAQLLHPKNPQPGQLLPPLYQRLRMAYDAALGINWLHGICSIVHRDLKPANLLLDENGRIKVTDFGFSEIIKGHGKDVRGPKGTALYMSPEVSSSSSTQFFFFLTFVSAIR